MPSIGAIGRGSKRALNYDFLLVVAVRGLERWDRLDPLEQQRFRELATRASGDATANLPMPEQKELKQLFRRLGVRRLVTELARLATKRDASSPPR
jgi:hypothetical protein